MANNRLDSRHTTLSGLFRPKTGPSRRVAGVGEERGGLGEERSCGEFEVNAAELVSPVFPGDRMIDRLQIVIHMSA